MTAMELRGSDLALSPAPPSLYAAFHFNERGSALTVFFNCLSQVSRPVSKHGDTVITWAFMAPDLCLPSVFGSQSSASLLFI